MTIFRNTAILCLLMMILASCAALTGRETAGEYIDDSAITTKVKSAIFKDPNLRASEIHVETFQGTVQLSGFVDSASASLKAAKHARSTKGVKSVTNNLVVRKNKR